MKLKNSVLLALALIVSSPLLAADRAELDCLVRPEMYVELSSPVDTTLKQLLVKIGDKVSKGQPLVQLENSVEIATLELAMQQAKSWSEVEDRRVRLQYAKRNLKRVKDLYSKNSVSLFEKDKADTEVELAKSNSSKRRKKESWLN